MNQDEQNEKKGLTVDTDTTKITVDPSGNIQVEQKNTNEKTDTQADENTLLKQQIDEQKDKYLRLFADFDNYKKRMARERIELIESAGKDVITSLLPVLDDFERAMKTMETVQDVSALKEGISLIQTKMIAALQAKGLKGFDSKGEIFDVQKHEAITEIPAGDEMKGKVVDEVERGYLLGDKMIRYAKVVVGK